MYGFEALAFTIFDGGLEAIVCGRCAGLLSAADYNNLCRCETVDDIKDARLRHRDTGPASKNEPSPLHTTTIVEKYTLELVDVYKHMLCQATVEPLSTFLKYIT